MRALLLYARSRQVPASALAAVACCLLVRVVSPSAPDPRWPALAITAAVCALATGLSGQDADLDRTAAWPWPLYRLGHVAAITVVAVVLVAGTAPLPFVLRGCVGMAGLAALGAAFFGGHLAWPLPCAAFAVTFFTDSWLVAPPDSVQAGVVMVAFGVAGTAVYVLFQPALKL
ncbi:hypothetical protein ACVDFE_28585 [Lentzea chajnantorensis]